MERKRGPSAGQNSSCQEFDEHGNTSLGLSPRTRGERGAMPAEGTWRTKPFCACGESAVCRSITRIFHTAWVARASAVEAFEHDLDVARQAAEHGSAPKEAPTVTECNAV